MKYSFTGQKQIHNGVEALLSRQYNSEAEVLVAVKERYKLNQQQLDILKAGGKVIKRNVEIVVNQFEK